MDKIVIISGIGQVLEVAQQHGIYPGIDPSKYTCSLMSKVVLITGASRGIGEGAAHAFAQAGASLFLLARKVDTLEVAKVGILKSVPQAKVAYAGADVVDPDEVKAAVEECVKIRGKIDVVVT